MSKKVWLVKWSRPSKVFKNERVSDFATCFTEEEAKEKYKELKKTDGITDLAIDETECCSL